MQPDMQAFIIRPFRTNKDIDFDRVERELIAPALAAHGIAGRTTADSLKQGNIRTEMFNRLLTADVVVVDISIHNANVFYELGIRHALREKRTYLIRCQGAELPPDEVPFDIRTDRYLPYDPANPAAALPTLTEGLRQTMASEDQDSPVFQLLPNLREQDASHFLVVPTGFREEVERALAAKLAGDLELLASEARGFQWEIEGLRLVGRAQFKLRAWQAARGTWEGVRKEHPDDLDANTLLATIYQRLGDLPRSDQAVQRVLARKNVAAYDRAEAFSLLGRNAKSRWIAEWEKLPAEQQRARALGAGLLEDAAHSYADAFRQDLNHFYSGLNALAMLTIECALAAALPKVWAERCDGAAEAARQLDGRRKQAADLAAAVGLSVQATLDRLKPEPKTDVGVELDVLLRELHCHISEADLRFLTAKRPGQVAAAYQKALDGADDFAVSAARTQIEIYQRLGILDDNVKAALSVFPPPKEAEQRPRALLFTGHRIDDPGRQTPRFPPDKEACARDAIRETVVKEREIAGGPVFGIAGGASGGDILFHEVCAELGIPTRLYLALPPDQFVAASVRSGGPQWVERFRQLRARVAEERVLADSEDLPLWLQGKRDYSIWQRNNLWELYNALALGGDQVTLIALWNGQQGDGPGGTADLVEKAEQRGAKTIILDTKGLFGL